MKKYTLLILGLLIAIQFAIPFTMIQQRENILNNGELFRFKTRPIDPADPFQGRYVQLGIDNNYIPTSTNDSVKIRYKTPIYASLETGADGFAHFVNWSREKPTNGSFLKTRYRGTRREWIAATETYIHKGMRIDIPFDRYYMDEAKAPRAELLTREATRATNCWVNVRILDGKAVIEDVFAEGQSLRDFTADF